MKIEFGCGFQGPKDGFLGCDTRKTPVATWVCNSWDITNFVEPGTVEEIYSRHFFEHLTFSQGLKTLAAWKNILCIDGKVTLITPDLHWHCEQFVSNRTEYASTRGFPQTGIFGWQRETESSDAFTTFDTSWDIHKSGYDVVTLGELVQECGFDQFRRLPGDILHNSNHPKHLHVEFYKKSP